MALFLIALHRPNGWEGTDADPGMMPDIDALNDEMVAAGVRVFVGGLQPTSTSHIIPFQGSEGSGPYLQADAFVNGFWVLNVADEAEALAWGRKAAAACRGDVEVRPFH